MDTLQPDLPTLFKALSDPGRIRILAAIIERPRPAADLAADLGLPARAVTQQVAFLCDVGLLARDAALLRWNPGPLHTVLSSLSERRDKSERADGDPEDQKVLANFLRDGKLVTIPAQHKKRQVVLRFLVERFETERMYDEREVNAILREYHDDVASLRRYLVVDGYLHRRIVQVVEADALIEGRAPRVEYRNSYWREPE